jgi:hypothetical protein
MSRLRYDGLTGTLGAAHNDSTTTLTLSSKLTYEGGDVPTIAAPDYLPLSILDSNGLCVEIVHVTAYTTTATSATMTRAKEGSAANAHSDGATFVHGPTAYDSGLAPVRFNFQTGTTYTLALTDASVVVSLTNAAGITLTVPPNSSVPFPIGTRVGLRQGGAGQVTVAEGSGVTVNTSETLKLNDIRSWAEVVKVGTDEWDLVGRLEAA